jgi:hypothetical protein
MKIALAFMIMALFGWLANTANPTTLIQSSNDTASPTVQITPTATVAPTAPIKGASIKFRQNLSRNGVPVSAICSFRFGLWDAPEKGYRKRTAAPLNNKLVVNGDVDFDLSFGDAVDGSNLWIQIDVRCKGDKHFTTFGSRIRAIQDTYTLSNGVSQP